MWGSLYGMHLQVFKVRFLLLLHFLLSLQLLNLLLHDFVHQTFLYLLINLLLRSGIKMRRVNRNIISNLKSETMVTWFVFVLFTSSAALCTARQSFCQPPRLCGVLFPSQHPNASLPPSAQPESASSPESEHHVLPDTVHLKSAGGTTSTNRVVEHLQLITDPGCVC